MNSKYFHLVSLGCAKNTVDSESMAAVLQQAGYIAVENPASAGIIIVNTCGFIEPARLESIAVLQEMAQKKRRGQWLVATGCLPQRHRQRIVESVPGVDGILGTRRWMDILSMVQRLRVRPRTIAGVVEMLDDPDAPEKETVNRVAVQGGSAYLKIADGCRRPCAFCSIPLIKGTLASRPVNGILKDARQLQQEGIQELILIAQDTTDYGHDLGLTDGLPALLPQILTAAPEIPWLRILYTYPGYVTDRLIEVMATNPRIVPYMDMPLQHAHPDTLKRMLRPANMDWVHTTIHKMRKAIPGLALRTTFIVGYPGETEEEFETLLDFVEEMQFDHVGVFPFSFEPGTASETLGDPVSAEEKEERIGALMELQEQISLRRNESFVGQEQDILVEGYDNGITVGRAYHDAPEIDGLVFAEGTAPVGSLARVKITGAMTHDLSGVVMPIHH